MKKPISIIILTLILLVLPSTLAYVTPTINLYDTMLNITLMPECVEAKGDIYCFSPEENSDGMYKYDVLEKNYSLLIDLNLSINPSSWDLECEYYNETDYIYCVGNSAKFKVRTDGTGLSNLLNYSARTEAEVGCDLRPNSDEIFCWGNDLQNNYLTKYDIGLDSWIELKEIKDDINGYVKWTQCEFRDENEFWCAGGLTNSSPYLNLDSFMIYYVDTNISEFKSAYPLTHGGCKWYDDILYCFGSLEEDGETIFENVTYYDPSTNVTGSFNTSIYVDMRFTSCVNYLSKSYCFGGYDNTENWFVDNKIYEFDFTEPFTPEQLGNVELESTYNVRYNPFYTYTRFRTAGCLYDNSYIHIDKFAGGSEGVMLWNLTDGSGVGYVAFPSTLAKTLGDCYYDYNTDKLLRVGYNDFIYGYTNLTDNDYITTLINSTLYNLGGGISISLGADDNYIYSYTYDYYGYYGNSDILAYHNKSLSLIGTINVSTQIEEVKDKLFTIRDDYLYTWDFKQVNPNFRVDVYRFSGDLIDDNIVYVGNYSFEESGEGVTNDYMYKFETNNHSTFYLKIGDNTQHSSAGGSDYLIRLDLADNDAPDTNWELQQPNNLLTTNQENLTFYFELVDDYHNNSNVTCVLYNDLGQEDNEFYLSNGIKNLTANSISEGIHTYFVNCTDSLGLSDLTSIKTIETDYTQPFLTVLSPNIDNSSVFWKVLNITFFGNDTNLNYYLYQIFDGIPTLLYSTTNNFTTQPNQTISQLVNTSSFSDGIHIFNIIVNDSGTNYNEKTYEMTRCTPDWQPYAYGDCQINDTKKVLVYQDNNGCGLDYGFNNEVYGYDSCDYCTPDFVCDSCLGRVCQSVKDSNTCYAITGLSSDNFTGLVNTYDSDCEYRSTYSTDDADNIIMDGIGAFLFALLKFIPLIVLFLIGLFMFINFKKLPN